MLSEKTAKQSEKTEAGDNSDGELAKANPVKSAATIGANRFLKKPSTPNAAEKQASNMSSAKTELNKGSGKAVENSPTLHRVEAFTKKYGRSSKISEPEPTSDSDLDLSLSMDEDILADVKELKKNRPASSVGEFSLFLAVDQYSLLLVIAQCRISCIFHFENLPFRCCLGNQTVSVFLE